MSPPERKRGAPAQGAPPKQMLQQPAVANGTEPGALLLVRNLQNVREQQRAHPAWTADCPVCIFGTLQIDYREGRYGQHMLLLHCRTCGRDVALEQFCEALGLRQVDVQDNNHQLLAAVKPPAPPEALPTPAAINGWCEQLANDREAMKYLRVRRGLVEATVRNYYVGHDGERFTLPVYDAGKIVGLRRYLPDAAPDVAKMKGLRGRTAKQLYPDLPPTGWILLCEGEWDALVARQHGLPSVTSTAGVAGWEETWDEKFRGRNIAIAYDCQGVSRDEAAKRAQALAKAAGAVRVVDLGLANKEDLTDWFVKYRRTAAALVERIKRTESFA